MNSAKHHTKIAVASVAGYCGRKVFFVQRAANFFRANPCQVLIEPFAGSAVVGLSLLRAGIIQRLILVERDERVARMLRGMVTEPDLADRYAEFDCTTANVEKLFREEKSAFRYLVQSRVCNRGKFSGGLRTKIDERWCREMVVTNLRRVYEMRDRITVVHGDAFEVMGGYAEDRSVGCFADPPYSADTSSKGHLIYRHHELSHPKLFSILAAWRGPWTLTEDNSCVVRRLALCHRFRCRRIVMNTSDSVIKHELMIWRKRPLC